MKEVKQIGISHANRDHFRDVKIRPIDHAIFARIFSYSKPYAFKRNILIVLVLMRAVQLPVLTWMIGAVIDGPIVSKDLRGLTLWIASFILFSLFTQICFHYRSRLSQELGENVIHDIRQDMLKKLISMPMGYFSKTRLGTIISRFSTDTEAVRVGIQSVVFVSLVQFGNMVIAAIMMAYYDMPLFLVVMAVAPVIWAMNRHFRLRLIHAYRQVQESFSRVSASVVESIRGIKVIQGHSREKLNAKLFRELLLDHSGYNIKVTETEAVFLPLLELNSQFFLSALIIIGGWRAIMPDGGITIGTLIQFLFLSNFFFEPIQHLATQYNNALTAMAGAERVFAFLDMKPDWSEKEDTMELETLKGEVEFDNVCFSYKEGKRALDGVSFKASPGQTIALVGQTGGGKTTITNLIAKFYIPDSGRILIDGRDILEIKASSLRKHLGIVLQMNFLFTGTVIENIIVGKPGATEEEAILAVKKLDCLDIIESLPDGFRTKVGENGVGLSLGQRQIICFSRAMLADPTIFILDEATSSIDSVTEQKLQNALAKLVANRTSFIVAHRLSTIRNANLLLVLENGRIVETGTHSQLLEKNGTYAALHKEFTISHEI